MSCTNDGRPKGYSITNDLSTVDIHDYKYAGAPTSGDSLILLKAGCNSLQLSVAGFYGVTLFLFEV